MERKHTLDIEQLRETKRQEVQVNQYWCQNHISEQNKVTQNHTASKICEKKVLFESKFRNLENE